MVITISMILSLSFHYPFLISTEDKVCNMIKKINKIDIIYY